MGKEADLIFTVPVGIPFQGLGEHELLMIALFLTIASLRNWMAPWIIKEIYLASGTAIAFDLECKR